VVIVVVSGGDKAEAGEVFLEPIASPGIDSFTPTVAALPPA